ncbi:IMP dehydrogenase [Candidatus Poriferisodalis sp.]|uniref:IMP dehydrogenase n=1 Tax=Candidatus Poriferisodalis sp. TaxID=3101277 RepID=UPI003B0262C6
MKLRDLSTGLTFDDVLIVPQRSTIRSRGDVSVRTRLSRNITLELPVVAANMDTVCEQEMAIAMGRLGGAGIVHRFMPIEAQADQISHIAHVDFADDGSVIAGAAVGTDHDMEDRAEALWRAGARVLVLDIAHGHADHAIDGLRRLKDRFADIDVIAGNVATAHGAVDLAEAGADAIKVGVGPGGACTTRLVAGVGVPQLAAIDNVVSGLAEAGHDVPVIADGGIRTSGDIAKALALGAASVMIGSMLAGTKESPGEVEQGPHGLRKRIRGMASFEAIEARAQRHGAVVDDEYLEQRAPEGVEGTVPYRGEAGKLIGELMAGLRSAMSYTNARNLAEFAEHAEFVAVTPLGLAENTPHATLSH